MAVAPVSSTAAFAQSSTTRTSSFAYDTATGLMIQEVIEPGTPALRLETDYTHDAYGNTTAATVSGVDIATRASTSTYDTRGQFATGVANALGQSESWQYDPRFGQPTSHTGPNGLTTTWSYDSLGRKILEVRPDGTRTKWAYVYCSGVNGGTAACPSGGAYLVTSTPYAADGATQNGPTVTVYVDTLGRELGRATQGFDGSVIQVSRQYDALGRVAQRSRPYFSSGGTPQWTTYGYDALSRAVVETRPDGSTKHRAFHGLVVSVTNALGETRTTTSNSQGQTVSVQDALGHITSYAYDPFGDLTKVTDAVGNVTAATYDLRGRRVAMSDPDMGTWTYAYDTLDEPVTQTDAKGQASTSSYDLLGRLVRRVEPDMTSVWAYDTAAHGIGQPALESITAGADAGYQRSYSYDALTRPVQVATSIGGTVYAISGAYDANGRLSQVTYPSGFVVNYAHTGLGDISQLGNASTGQVYWTANAADAELHLTRQTAGNGIVTTQGFDAATGRLTSIAAGANSAVESFSYTWDRKGNLLARADANENLSESFVYDSLNRLTSATVSLSTVPAKTFSYDPIGNLLTKSDVGTYAYPAAGAARPHAVTSISGATISTTFTYDADGNETSGLGRSIGWTSFNMPASITQGTTTVSFGHDVDHQRFRQVAPEGTTLYFDAFGVHAELFAASTSQWREYLTVGGAMIAVRFDTPSAGTVTTRYCHQDHLGSVAVLTDENGAVVERDSYDAWGKRRYPSGADDPTGSITSQTVRGFTGQEQLADVGLVHLNGRVYDPMIGRFTTADTLVPNPRDGQSLNRYSYVRNRPLSAVDPSGHQDAGDSGGDVGDSGADGGDSSSDIFSTYGYAATPAPAGTWGNRIMIYANPVGFGVSEDLYNSGSSSYVGSYSTGSSSYPLAGSYDPSGVGAALFSETMGYANGLLATTPTFANPTVAPFVSPTYVPTYVPGLSALVAAAAMSKPPAGAAHATTTSAYSYASASSWPAYVSQLQCMGMCHGFDAGTPRPMTGSQALGLNALVLAVTIPIPIAGEVRAAEGVVDALVGGTAAEEVGGALVPMADAAFNTGTIRTIAGYEVAGNAGLVGSTYNINIWGLYATEDAQGLGALANAFKAEAGAAGATDISISGNAIINPGIANMNPAIAARYGFSFSRVNSTTIMLQGPVP